MSSHLKPNRYAQIIERVFSRHCKKVAKEFEFERKEIEQVAKELNVELPKNLGDILYSIRFRQGMPESIAKTAPKGKEWIIKAAGRSRYRFACVQVWRLTPHEHLTQIKVPDATPGVIAKYALSDEQALLAKLRYNRLIDIFTGLTCYSLQNHLRTSVVNMGQIETDEIYIGVDRQGTHYVLPVQAKGGRDKMSVVQIEQDMALAAEKFPNLICRPIAAQFMAQENIALFELEKNGDEIAIRRENHYRLVPHDQVTAEDLRLYREASSSIAPLATPSS